MGLTLFTADRDGSTWVTAWRGEQLQTVVGLKPLKKGVLVHGLVGNGDVEALLLVVRSALAYAYGQMGASHVDFQVNHTRPGAKALERLYSRYGAQPRLTTYRITFK